MSCPRESTYAIWLDGELPLAERHPVEAHLVGCQACRALVLALRDEAELLGDVLHDRLPPAFAPEEVENPARGLALGFLPAAAAVTLALTGVGWLLENVPASVEWMNPFQLKGATEMLFKLIFLIRDEAPGLLGLGVAIAATAGLGAVLSFAVSAISRRLTGPGTLAMLMLVLVLAPGSSEAHFGLHKHDDFELPAGETHDGTLIVSGGTVNIDGIVSGDLFVLAERLSLRGEVRGNVFALGETVELGGVVSGSVHVGSDRAELTGLVEGDLYVGAENFEISRDGRVARDTLAWVSDGVIEGDVERDLYTSGRRMEVRGTIGRDVHARRIRLAIRDGAQVGGDVTVWTFRDGDLEVSPGARIGGTTQREEIPDPHRMFMARYGEIAFYVVLAVQFVAAFLVGMLLHVLVPGVFAGRLETSGAFFRAMGVGFLAAIATPLVLLIVAVTLVGIPLALMGLAVYLGALYCSTILVGALVGRALVRASPSEEVRFRLSLLAGLALVLVVAHLPFVGWPVHLVVLLTGLGLLIERVRVAWSARRLSA